MNIKYPVENVHTLSVEEILAAFQTDASKGITTAEADNRAQEFGANIHQAQKQRVFGSCSCSNSRVLLYTCWSLVLRYPYTLKIT